ncbi:hypothetical protein [Fretibacter rubidus]|uniref:hypothetical protein n=1 Tax=Fretibacter rubidus TaxID=570162 RepID=UPI00352AA9B9
MRHNFNRVSIFILALTVGTAALADDSCEIVTMDLTVSEKTEDNVRTAKFHDAKDFIDSVYDDTEGHIKEVDGKAVLAVMCERDTLLPQLRDLPLIKTGLPLSLSQDFDSTESGLLTVYDDGTAYRTDYTGPETLAPDTQKLKDVMEIINLQRLTK